MKTAISTYDITESTRDQVTSEVHEHNVRETSWQGKRNTLNNHTFMNLVEPTGIFDDLGNPVIKYTLVEVVRKGKYNSRIRRDLESNTNLTELVSTDKLSPAVA